MRFLVRFLIIVLLLSGVLYAAGTAGLSYWQARNRPKFRFAKVETGDITSVVNSTGEVRPVLSVAVGSFVSGPVIRIHGDFNQRVKKGDLLAEIDPRIYAALVASDQAALANRLAEVERVKALLQQAVQDEERAEALSTQGKGFISPSELDQFHFSRLSLQAQLNVAKATVDQAQAALENSQANLGYTKILSPVDGIIIDRKIDPGQTLAAQFQTPELFKIAPQMDEKMLIHASVDEADIGLIRQAQEAHHPVTFSVDAYPTELFTGSIDQIRFSSTLTQNVVTYPVVVSAGNPDLKLLPGMTADLSFEIDNRKGVTKVPNGALRFYPKIEQVRPADQALLNGTQIEDARVEPNKPSAPEKTDIAAQRSKRHVWVVEGEKLRAIPIEIGINDSQFTELVSGELKVGDELVTSEATQ